MRRAERAVSRFWRVIDRLSADPESDLTELTTVSRVSVAAQWARNINQYRYDQVTTKGRVAVRDASATKTKDDDLFKGTACIDVSNVNLVDKRREVRRASERSSPGRVRLHRRQRQSEVVRHQGKGDGNVLKRGRADEQCVSLACSRTLAAGRPDPDARAGTDCATESPLAPDLLTNWGCGL